MYCLLRMFWALVCCVCSTLCTLTDYSVNCHVNTRHTSVLLNYNIISALFAFAVMVLQTNTINFLLAICGNVGRYSYDTTRNYYRNCICLVYTTINHWLCSSNCLAILQRSTFNHQVALKKKQKNQRMPSK